MSVAEMALSLYAVNNGYMDKVTAARWWTSRPRCRPSRAPATGRPAEGHQRQAGPAKDARGDAEEDAANDSPPPALLSSPVLNWNERGQRRLPWPAPRKSAARSRASRARRRSPRPWKWWRRARCAGAGSHARRRGPMRRRCATVDRPSAPGESRLPAPVPDRARPAKSRRHHRHLHRPRAGRRRSIPTCSRAAIAADARVAGEGRDDQAVHSSAPRAWRSSAASGCRFCGSATRLGDRPHIEDLIGAVKVMLDAYRDGKIDRLLLVKRSSSTR